jgi:RNA polymerase sigma-70 factor, ECF subfamily
VVESEPTRERLELERRQVADAQADPRCFADLYESNFEAVYAFVARRATNRSEAEDITATVFQKAIAGMPSFEWRGVPFVAWLVRIARNELIARSRDQSTPVPDPQVETSGDLEDVERRAALFSLVRTLPEDQRRVIALRFVEQWSIKEIAAELARSEGAVKQLQFRALTTLRTRVGEHDA